jgi:hypothetical protein
MRVMNLPGAPTPRSSATGPTNETPSLSDWPKQATGTIVRVVDGVRDKTTGPVLSIAGWVVYGTVVALLAIPLLVLLLIGLFRLLEHILIKLGEWRGWTFLVDPMWLVYLLCGATFTLMGLILWRRAGAAPEPEPA